MTNSTRTRRGPRQPVSSAVPAAATPVTPTPEPRDEPTTAEPTPADAMSDADTPPAEPVDPPADPPEKIRPRRYAPGDIADRMLYGLIASDGTVTATADGGTTEPAPGERGTILAMPGQQIGHAAHRLLYPPES